MNNELCAVGTIIRYEDAISEVESAQRFVIVENRFPRLLVSDLRFINNPSWPITPTQVVSASDMIMIERKEFKEFNYLIPVEFSDSPLWEDSSWHNDICASVERIERNKHGMTIKVFIAEDNPAEREVVNMKRFLVCLSCEGALYNFTECDSMYEVTRAIALLEDVDSDSLIEAQ